MLIKRPRWMQAEAAPQNDQQPQFGLKIKLSSPTCSSNSTPNAFIASDVVIFQQLLCLCKKVPLDLRFAEPQADDE